MSTFGTLKRFFSPIGLNPGIHIRGFIQTTFWAVDPIIHVFFIQYIIASVEQKNKESLTFYSGFYVVYIIYYLLFSHVVKKWGWVEQTTYTKRDLSRIYMDKFFTLDNTKVESIGTGKLVATIEKGLDKWSTWQWEIMHRGTIFFFVFLYVIYQLFINNVSLLITFLTFSLVLLAIAKYINDRVLIERNKVKEYDTLFTKQLVKMIMSKFEILQSKKSKQEIKVLDDLSDNIYQSTVNQVRYLHRFFNIPEVVLGLCRVLLCYFLGIGVIEGNFTFAGFVGVSTSIILMDRALDYFLKLYKDFTKELPDIEKLWELFDTTPQIHGYHSGKNFLYTTGDICLQNIDFSYGGKNHIFEKFSLDIQGSKITALVGPSGGGKTTLAKLISGYISPDSGQIIIDNQKLHETSLKSYYKTIGYLTQEPSVFDGTVLENLTYAIDSKLPSSKIQEAIKLAHCEFIYDLPHGLDTEIGERGVKLSGGQKQRLAIAKLILKNPHIIILDEPTSALDSFSEERITEAFQNLFVGRTVIVIAHRLQTVKKADEIIVLESGKVIERGNHNSLVKKGGYYKKMLDLQSGF